MMRRAPPGALTRAGMLSAVALWGALMAGAAAAEPKYTLKDVTACSKDAMRLCRDKLPDLERIEECMRANIDNLRPACRARFSQAH